MQTADMVYFLKRFYLVQRPTKKEGSEFPGAQKDRVALLHPSFFKTKQGSDSGPSHGFCPGLGTWQGWVGFGVKESISVSLERFMQTCALY